MSPLLSNSASASTARRNRLLSSIMVWVVVVGSSLLVVGCDREPDRAEPTYHQSTPTPASEVRGISWRRQSVGERAADKPWITHVRAVDLDADGRVDILACDAASDTVVWLRNTGRRQFEERVLGRDLPGPAHVEASDMDGDGDLDVLVSVMGQIFPNNDPIGSVVILEQEADGTFTPHTVLAEVARVTDVRARDLDSDGDVDLAVGQFGYFQGEVRWLENMGGWEFKSHRLLNLPGTVNAPIVDTDGDGDFDIVAHVTQEFEEVHLFVNDGTGEFRGRVINKMTNEDDGGSGLVVADVDGDGDPDVVYTNGDGFDYADPGPRPWHGVQWLENRGDNQFWFRRVGSLAGAYAPAVRDFDNDGDQDIVATSGFNDWSRPDAISLALFRNDGSQSFTRVVIAQQPTHLMTADAADFDDDGRVDLVTGGFHAYPPYDAMSRISIWWNQVAP